MHYLQKFWNSVLNILFPPMCISCHRDSGIPENRIICEECFNNIEINEPLHYIEPWFSLGAVGSYNNEALKELIHVFKYKNIQIAADSLIDLVNTYIDNLLMDSELDIKNSIIIPVPLHPRKLKKRGFNQAEIIARGISKHFNLTMRTDILLKSRDTKSQTESKNNKEKLENVKGSFQLNPAFAKELKSYQANEPTSFLANRLILFDDVYTSGATMMEAAKTLRKGGAKNIIGLVIAKT